MVAIGMLLIWGGYSTSLWGWCLLRGYNVTLGQLVSPLHPYGQGKGQGWPPAHIPDSQVFPGAGSSPGPGSNPLGQLLPQGFQLGAKPITPTVYPTPTGQPPSILYGQ